MESENAACPQNHSDSENPSVILEKPEPKISAAKFQQEREYHTFVVFHNLVTKSQMMPFYRFNSGEIIQRLKFFRQAFIEELPDL